MSTPDALLRAPGPSTKTADIQLEEEAEHLIEVGYLIIVDYYSRYPEANKHKTTASGSVIEGVTAVLSRHGILRIVLSDNGQQFSSMEFAKFVADYTSQHNTSSPHFP